MLVSTKPSSEHNGAIISPLSYRFEWNSEENSFKRTSIITKPLPDPLKQKFSKLLTTIESESGIRYKPHCWYYLLSIVVSLLGFSFGFIFIMVKLRFLGSIMIVTSPFFSFYIGVGKLMMRGTQIDCITEYFSHKKDQLDELIWEDGFSVSFFFSESTPI